MEFIERIERERNEAGKKRCKSLYSILINKFCIGLIIRFITIALDNDDDWNFATKLTELSESNEESAYESHDSDIFHVKFIGKTRIESPKSEEATANAIKTIISTAKCKFPLLASQQ